VEKLRVDRIELKGNVEEAAGRRREGWTPRHTASCIFFLRPQHNQAPQE